VSWEETTLGEAIDLFDSQRIPLSSKQRSNRRGEYPYYGAQGIIDWIDDYIFDGRYILIPEDGENLNSRKLPIAYFADGKFWVNNHAHIARGKRGKADDRFIKHWLNAQDIKPYVTGAAQPKLSQGNLRQIPIRLPNIRTQRRIADVLSAYDDLIENNTRRIAILEDMARRLFEAWFGRAAQPERPEGFLRDVAEQCGRTINPQRYESALFSHFSLPAFDNGKRPTRELGSSIRSNKLKIEEPLILLSRLNPRIPRVWPISKLPEDQAICSTEFLPLMPRGGYHFAWLLELLRSDAFQSMITSAVGGTSTSHQRVRPEVVLNMPVRLPSPEHAQRFGEVAGPMSELTASLIEKNANLRATRDLLLPKLISGEIEVRVAEDALEAAAA